MKQHAVLFLSLSSMLLFACGDDISDGRGGTPDAGPGGADAGADVDGAPGADAGNEPGRALALGGDYNETGTTALVDVDALTVELNPVAGVVGGDPAVRRFGDRVVVVNRGFGGNVTVLDAADLSLVAQIGIPDNAQDAAIVGDTLYVAALDAAGVHVIDLSAAEPVLGDTISLAGLDDVDGVPDCNSLHAVGSQLFVSCGILDRDTFAPRGPGAIAVIDTGDDTVTTDFTLSTQNPFGRLQPYAGDLLVSTLPNFADLTEGCLERITTGAEPGSAGCFAQGSELGGFAAAYREADGELWVAVAESFSGGRVTRHDGAAWSEGSLVPAASNPTDLAVCPGGDVLVADNAPDSRGVRVLAADGSERTGEPLDVGWPEVFAPVNAMICW